MPIKQVKRNGEIIGYKWGDQGKLYTIDKYGLNAKNMASKQGRAIKVNQSKRKMKRARPKQHTRQLKSGKKVLINKGRKKNVRKRIKKSMQYNYGFIISKKPKKEDIFLQLESPQFKRAVSRKQFEDKPRIKHKGKILELEKFGEGDVSSFSGKKVGGGLIAASAIPIIVPAPITVPLGTAIASKVEKVKVIRTDEQDRPLRIPKIEFHLKK